jgi:Protein of unknown function (DUF3618)
VGQSPEELRREIERTRHELSQDLDAIGDRVRPGRIVERRRNRLRGRVVSLRERVMGVPAAVGSTVSEHTPSMPSAGGVSDRVGGAGEALRSAPETARSTAQGNPLLAGAVAFGAGFVAAAIFKGSEAEARAATTLQEKAQPLKEEAQNVAREVASGLQEPASQAASSLKETAASGAESVKEAAQSSAQQTKEAGQSAVEDVKAKAPGTS